MKDCLTRDDVARAIEALDDSTPRGEERFKALNEKLDEMFGQHQYFGADDGLGLLEEWTGHQVRGVMSA